MKKVLLLAVTLLVAVAFFSCTKATVKVENDSSYNIRYIWVGLTYFSDTYAPGQSSIAETTIIGTYNPTFNRQVSGTWYSVTATEALVVTGGLFAAHENVWTYENSTAVY